MKSLFRRGIVFPVLLLAGSIEVAALAHVWVRMQVVQIGYEIAREKKAAEELVRSNQRLRIEVAWLKNPSRVESIAVRELDMGPADPARIRVVSTPGKESTRAFAKR